MEQSIFGIYLASWTAQDIRLWLMVLALIFARAIDQVLYYRIAIGMKGYTWYFSAFILPVALLLILTPITYYRYRQGKVTRAMLAFPQRKIALLGGLDTAYNVLSSLPIAAIGGTVANVTSQAVLPFNMLLSWLVLKYRFVPTHYIGAILVLYGVCVRLLPQFTGASEDEAGTATGAAFLGWMLVMVLSAVPNAASNVAKEVVLKGADMDEWYLNMMVGVWQIGFGILTMWTVWIPGTEDYIPPSEFGNHVQAANKCFFGVTSRPQDDCGQASDSGAPIVAFCFFILFNVAYNMLMLYIFKAGSSVLFVVASAARLPLVDILLMFGFLAGPAQATFTVFDGFALVALVLAITTYNLNPEIKPAVVNVPALAVSTQKSSDQRQLLGAAGTDSDEDIDGKHPGHPGETPGGMSLAPMGRTGGDYGSMQAKDGAGRGRSRADSV